MPPLPQHEPAQHEPASPLDAGTLAFAARVFAMAREGDEVTLADLLDGGLPPDLTNDKGDTLLILAAYHRHAGVVHLLLEHGADTSRANDRGQTALAAAVFRQDAGLVGALLAAGADPDGGSPSARATAAFFELPAMTAALQAGAARRGA